LKTRVTRSGSSTNAMLIPSHPISHQTELKTFPKIAITFMLGGNRPEIFSKAL